MLLQWQRIQPGQGHSAGRALLAQLYRQLTAEPMPEILIGQWGKPYFAHSNVHFSISHTKTHAFCVVSEHPVGIDAEELGREIDLRLAEKILSPAEKARFATAEDKRLALLKFWVLKEAAAKLSGKGLQGYPNQSDFSPEDSRIQIIDGCLVAVMEEKENAV